MRADVVERARRAILGESDEGSQLSGILGCPAREVPRVAEAIAGDGRGVSEPTSDGGHRTRSET